MFISDIKYDDIEERELVYALDVIESYAQQARRDPDSFAYFNTLVRGAISSLVPCPVVPVSGPVPVPDAPRFAYVALFTFFLLAFCSVCGALAAYDHRLRLDAAKRHIPQSAVFPDPDKV